ncbi:MAG TPA: ATP-binding protein [Gemmatimonadaceae bacterium]|nr:ATP-binding protein [Gemmatimonadaceae bacterium]
MTNAPPATTPPEIADTPRGAMAFVEGLLAVAVASLLSWYLRDELVATRLLLFWVASAYAAWRGGLWPALVASLLGVVLANYTTTQPFGAFTRPTTSEVFSAAVFVFVNGLLGATIDRLRHARAAAEEAARQLEVAGVQLQDQAAELEYQLEESQVMAEELEQSNAQLGELSAENEHGRAQLEQAAHGMSDAMLVFDASWRLVFGNAAAASLLKRVGKDVRALQGRIVWDDLPLLAAEEIQSVLRGAALEKRVVEQDLRYEPADLWIHVRGVPTADGGLATFIQDRTAARSAEIARERIDQRYRALVEASTVMVWTADPSGAVEDMPALRELTGQSPQEVRGSGWLDAIHPADRNGVRARWSAAIASGYVYEGDFRLRLGDGTHRWLHSRAVPIRSDGRIVEWVGVFEDTHEAHVEAERRAAVENSLSVLGSSLDYEWTLAALTRLVVPALGDYCSVDLVEPDGSIRRVSTTHVDPEKEELVRVMWARYPYDPAERFGVPEVVRTGQPQVSVSIDPAATAAFARDPEHASMLARLAPRSYACIPMTARGHTFGALSLVYSDSGRRYDEADLNAAQEIAARAASAIDNARLYAAAQAANRAKSEFLATMSHELRTPLNAIAGYAELLAMGVRGPVNEEQLRDLSRIQQNQQHLLEIITDILNFSRIEAGRVRYVLAAVPVRDVLARMEGMIEPQARARSIEYRCENVADGVAVVADREKLEQVLINLLGNAVKFTPSGGRITLSADTDGDRVRLHVRDTGIGIEPEHVGSIFEPFVQLEPALTRTAEGAGLGLAISRELARGMGGELGVTSSPGAGSTFTVELPRAAAGDQLVG